MPRSVRKLSVSLKVASWLGFLGLMTIKFNICPESFVGLKGVQLMNINWNCSEQTGMHSHFIHKEQMLAE